MFGHPDDGGEEAPIPVGKVKNETHMAEKVFAIHNGEKIDLTGKVRKEK